MFGSFQPRRRVRQDASSAGRPRRRSARSRRSVAGGSGRSSVGTVDGALARIARGPEGNPVGDRHDHADPDAMEARDGVVEVAEQALVMPSARCGLDPGPADVHPDPRDVRALEQPDLAVDVRPRDAVGELGVGAGVGRAGGRDAGEAHQSDERGEGREGRRTRNLERVHAVSSHVVSSLPARRAVRTRGSATTRAPVGARVISRACLTDARRARRAHPAGVVGVRPENHAEGARAVDPKAL